LQLWRHEGWDGETAHVRKTGEFGERRRELQRKAHISDGKKRT
jgi:hypothetical protein